MLEAGDYGLECSGNFSNWIFKNGVFYSSPRIECEVYTKIIVPSNIDNTNEAYIAYAEPKLQNFLNSAGYNDKITLKRASNNRYYVCNKDLLSADGVIIEKENGILVNDNIFVNNLTGVQINCKETKNQDMEKELKNKGYNYILNSYELTLIGADKLLTPVDITFTIGNEYNDRTVMILHKKKDRNYESFEKKIENGKVTITVSELSPFVLALKDGELKDGELKDETPKTGKEKNSIVSSLIVAILSIGAIATMNKKH